MFPQNGAVPWRLASRGRPRGSVQVAVDAGAARQMWFMRSAVRAWAAFSASLSTQSVLGGVVSSWAVSSRVSSVGARSSRPPSRAKSETSSVGSVRRWPLGSWSAWASTSRAMSGVQTGAAEGGGGRAQEVDVGGGPGQRGHRRVLVAAVRREQPAAPGSPGLGGRQGGEQALHGGEGDPVGQWRRQPQRLGVGARILLVVVLPRAQAQQDFLQGAQRRQRLAVEVDDEHGALPWPGFLARSGMAGRLLSHGQTTARWPTGGSCR